MTAPSNAATASQNVLMVPSPNGEGSHGGALPTSGFPDGYAPAFSNADPDDIADGTIANPLIGIDTVVLVQLCRIGDLLADSDFKTRVESFVSGGGKLVIWDSECSDTSTPDYSNFIFPFQSNNPGAGGSACNPAAPLDCFLHDVEENMLGSSNPASPLYVDTALVASETDAVGDANVFTSQNPAWCVDMTAKNIAGEGGAGTFGPVQSYARLGAGLIIYNGLDMDGMSKASFDNSGGSAALAKIYLQNLTQPFAPDNLPCGVVATGITLSPASATNPIGQNHTVTATVKDAVGDPIVGRTVNFEIFAGPNAAKTGSGITDANGQAVFTYTSSAPGTDEIRATFDATPPDCVDELPPLVAELHDNCLPDIRTSNVATKTWIVPAPIVATLDVGKPKARLSVASCRKLRRSIKATVSDASGIASVKFYLDGKLIRTDRHAPFSVTLNTKKLRKGSHRLTTKTTDKAGNTTRTTRRFAACKSATRKVTPKFTG
ncbi:MAG: Ig-like domain-containing protein [Solirubrobacterales bacterium]